MSYRKDRIAIKEGKILKERRQELGFTQLEVASECGVELQQYQRFEYGQRRFTTCRMSFRPGISGRLFQALGEHGVNIRTLAQGADELSIIIGVDNKHFETAIRVMYDGFAG